jgi:hypothetical protein
MLDYRYLMPFNIGRQQYYVTGGSAVMQVAALLNAAAL